VLQLLLDDEVVNSTIFLIF